MPIPEYLQKYAVDPQTKKNHTAFDLRCTCGHELFRASRRVETKEEKRLVKPYYDYLLMVFSGPRKVTKDEDGTVRHWHTEDGEWVEDNYPVRPFFAGIEVFRVTCAACGHEITVFDSRYHGYDALYCDGLTPEAKDYEPTLRPTGSRDGSPMRIALKLEQTNPWRNFGRTWAPRRPMRNMQTPSLGSGSTPPTQRAKRKGFLNPRPHEFAAARNNP